MSQEETERQDRRVEMYGKERDQEKLDLAPNSPETAEPQGTV